MPFQILAILNLFHTVSLECQGALDLIVWKERCNTDGGKLARLANATWWSAKLRRPRVIRQARQKRERFDERALCNKQKKCINIQYCAMYRS